jgi:GPH family glycoside/pentoside/hexuronide:cation symporter
MVATNTSEAVGSGDGSGPLSSSGILPMSLKILYSFGQMGVNLPTYFFVYLWAIYAPHGGTQLMSASLLGLAYGVGVIIQALANPFIGNLSDKLKWKMGRRRPFILTGFIPLAVSFMLLFRPISHNQIANFVYVAVDFAIFNFFYAFVVLPYLAMIPEISLNSNDRVKLLSVSSYFNVIPTILLLFVTGILLNKGYPFFDIGALVTVIIIISFAVPLVSIRKERFQSRSPQSFNLQTALFSTLRNRTFLIFIAGYVFIIFGMYSFVNAITYYTGIVILPGSTEAAYSSYSSFILAIIFVFLAVFSVVTIKLSKRLTKKKAMIILSSVLALGMVLLGVMPSNPPLVVLIPILAIVGMGATAPIILTYAILSDIIDEDELKTGFRREGMYFGIQGLIERVPYALSGAFVGLYYTTVYLPSNSQVTMRYIAFIAALSTVIMAVIFTRVPVKEKLKG